MVAGKDTDGLMRWLESSLERNPGLRSELARIVSTSPNSSFADKLRAQYPQLLGDGDE